MSMTEEPRGIFAGHAPNEEMDPLKEAEELQSKLRPGRIVRVKRMSAICTPVDPERASIFDVSEDDAPYASLREALEDAFAQAAYGKGKARHTTKDEPFEEQDIIKITALLGPMAPTFQVVKKIKEGIRMLGRGQRADAIQEFLGAVVYAAAIAVAAKKGKI
jgi:hypothetical protein